MFLQIIILYFDRITEWKGRLLHAVTHPSMNSIAQAR